MRFTHRMLRILAAIAVLTAFDLPPQDRSWNGVQPQAEASNRVSVRFAGRRGGRAPRDPPTTPSETGPFYGRAGASIDRRPSREDEIGPFYGHALPQDVFGSRLGPCGRGRPEPRQ